MLLLLVLLEGPTVQRLDRTHTWLELLLLQEPLVGAAAGAELSRGCLVLLCSWSCWRL